MTPKRYSNPVLEELYKSACNKFGEEKFRTACDLARKKLDEQTCDEHKESIEDYYENSETANYDNGEVDLELPVRKKSDSD